ncbi:hypothetical protein KV697_13875 [Sphingomonas sanguinis]|uniref:hypothetical protein n=1 Tax=Sphingomonas sanguinis TaxID=33051 RepID=UPI001C56504E|nr:hypothetical protein [Sphingomonas sanguinis]QXT34864.1 hypothetical protein KV697_13875 [Sphingomonas sanguinis]
MAFAHGAGLYQTGKAVAGGHVHRSPSLVLSTCALPLVGSGSLFRAVLAVQTDVLHQWKSFLPKCVRRLTPVAGFHVSDLRVGGAKFITRIKAERVMLVRDVSLRRVAVAAVTGTPVLTENFVGYSG